MNTIRLILGLMIGGIEVAAGRRKGAVSSYYTSQREREDDRPGRPLSLGKTPRWHRGRRAEDLEWWQKYNGASPPRNARRFMPVWPRAQGKSGAQLAAALGRDASVVNREITRNGGRSSYSGMDAQTRACRRPKCAVRNKVADTPVLRDEVLALFATGATSKQIEVALRRRHGLDRTRRVSHETIYDFIYVHSKGSVKKEWIAYLRRKKPRRSPAPRAKGKLSGQLPGAINIGERPAEVERREVPRHREADLVMGAGNRTAILVIIERVSRYVMIVPLGGAKDAISVARALIRAFKRLPAHLRKTLTYDNGHKSGGLLLQSTQPLAARCGREYQRSDPGILP
ncbi:MAG: IS30 family transposase [Candidatus Synoicihabitans palmerolidicus]|nr:IS30 family transposase [Candidatus Synoicihabitans palmerolidicus]